MPSRERSTPTRERSTPLGGVGASGQTDRMPFSSTDVADLLLGPNRAGQIRHVQTLPARDARSTDWPDWADPAVVAAWQRLGVAAPWQHQAAAATATHAGRHVVLATGTASGKSLAYLLPVLTALRAGVQHP